VRRIGFQFFPSCSPAKSGVRETSLVTQLSILSQLQQGFELNGEGSGKPLGIGFQFFPSCSARALRLVLGEGGDFQFFPSCSTFFNWAPQFFSQWQLSILSQLQQKRRIREELRAFARQYSFNSFPVAASSLPSES
jgi:putative component of membrane protein insertase Oxa1/YidC/SpoIIIJ protein YidD